MTTEILTPVGRLVGGHPMKPQAVVDRLGKPKLKADGVTPRMSLSVGVAIQKGAETHWSQTEWGGKIYQEGVSAFPRGEHGAPTFAWKVTDGDSQTPNKKGNKPCDREGYPGHWVIWATTELPFIRCYHAGKYDPTQQIQNAAEIKPGDYCRLVLTCKGNESTESPGVYINPEMFELTRAGVEIQLGDAPDAAAAFGAAPAALPGNAQLAQPGPTGLSPVTTGGAGGLGLTNTAQASPHIPPPVAPGPIVPPPVQPNPAFLNGPPVPPPAVMKYLVGGQEYTKEQLEGFGWNAEQIASVDHIPF